MFYLHLILSYFLMVTPVRKQEYSYTSYFNYQQYVHSFLSHTCRYKASMIEDIPHIFEAVFQCTLEVSTCVCHLARFE